MQNHDLVQATEASNYLNKDFPDVVLLKQRLFLLVLSYSLEQVAVVCVFHHDAKVRKRLDKGGGYHKEEEGSSMKASL